MPKGALYNDPTCTKTVPIKVLAGSKTKNPDGSKAFTLQAAQSVGGAPTDQFLVSLEPRATSAKLVLWRLRIVNGNLRVSKTAEAVKRVALPPYGYQCDSTNQVNTWWDTGDLRLRPPSTTPTRTVCTPRPPWRATPAAAPRSP